MDYIYIHQLITLQICILSLIVLLLIVVQVSGGRGIISYGADVNMNNSTFINNTATASSGTISQCLIVILLITLQVLLVV